MTLLQGEFLNLYKAKLNTSKKTSEQIKNELTGLEPNEEEIQNWLKIYGLIAGVEVIVAKSWSGDGYCLVNWLEKDSGTIKEFFYHLEQDPMFGSYFDEREEFEEDWQSGEYCPACSIVFSDKDVEIIEIIVR
ncbi:hypothetical protein HOO54_23685 [Bacillus sp. WMMC1349]|uniref:hypothetical protein n=1 Tax=Bacillus sp. WMMC1349 TaxID=2736254 RepID=UPI001551A46F|nr:hypothetical protein [Bacillus sp. WMMC1349]NPC91004.1 hypothetical protein [Bacillus sp. WMMC1349]NPC91049.1 hypothetical protein [Bacillus sp. WMMC1349]NPC94988.1 hypothetical protein [Bacillus sp. WMMC1349]NPC95024.1 hypothetical protein [Bacillus sp. WMMC1349]NPC95058.1 hypothetical protein [Bacillus sp. WMMC1349]